ncbi:MAG: cysteinyl-tRNA synthetase, partial [Bermanella sp.]
YRALLDDLNSPVAISELYRLAKKMHAASGEAKARVKAELMGLAKLMGLLQQDPEQWFTRARGGNDIGAEAIEALIEKRKQAKSDKDYAGADRVRRDLLDMGVVLEDSREGTTWRRS